MEPTENMALKPTFSLRLQSRTAEQNAPLWLKKATFPGLGINGAKVAFRPLTGLITPRQFGPMMRRLPRRASARIWRSRSRPTAPDSLKPADRMIAPWTPASTQSLITDGTVDAGVAMTASSTFPGIDVT